MMCLPFNEDFSTQLFDILVLLKKYEFETYNENKVIREVIT